MSLAGIVQKAIKIAKRNLGDVVATTTYSYPATSDYDVSQGSTDVTWASAQIEYVVDKFTFEELQSGQYQETDVKITVFNPEGTLNFQIKEFVLLDGKALPIFRAIPIKVGAYTPVWSLILRA